MRRAILDPRRLPLPCFLSSFFSFLRFTVFFSQKRGFPLKAGGSPTILAATTWQYSSNTVWVLFCFCCYFSAALFPLAIIGDFRSGIVHCGASAFLPLQSTVVVVAILTAASYPTTSHRRFALRALSFASFSSTLSPHHILADPLSALQHSRHTEEGRVNG